MSKFVSYVERANSIATSSFDNYKEARDKYQKAEARYKAESSRYKDPAGTNYRQQSIAARAKADLLEAEQALRDAQKFMQDEISSVQEVGRELQEAVYREYAAKGEEVDLATLELLKSGILKSQEYFTLYETARGNGNNTMMRLIGKYADEAADKAPTRELQERLHTLYNIASVTPGKEYMDAFSVLEDAYRRTANNPDMIPRWDEMTAAIIKNF